eukprot:7301544-Pyramimonas_sp.AAC.1
MAEYGVAALQHDADPARREWNDHCAPFITHGPMEDRFRRAQQALFEQTGRDMRRRAADLR